MTGSVVNFNQAYHVCPICNGVFSDSLKRIEADRQFTKDIATYKECICPKDVQVKLEQIINDLHGYGDDNEVYDDDIEKLIEERKVQKYNNALDDIVKNYK